MVEHLLLERLQLRTGIDAQFLGQVMPDSLVGAQRF